MEIEFSLTKNYAIGAMVQDISIQAAIFDLIDNAIDAARAINLKNYSIFIEANSNSFCIKDNCGGINPKLITEVFKIGSRKGKTSGFGVGMKRAIIKLGNNAEIFSYNEKQSYKFIFDVAKWKRSTNWNIHADKINTPLNCDCGLIINISKLNNEMQSYINTASKNNLRHDISKRYRLILNDNIKIILNNKEVPPYKIENLIKESSTYTISNIKVKIKLYKKTNINEKNGWDIFINERCICERNTSKDIQWSKASMAGYSYKDFIGEVLINGEDVHILPFNSAKDKINFEWEIMKKVMDLMYDFLFKFSDNFKKSTTIIQFEKDSARIQLLKDYFDENRAKIIGEKAFDELFIKIKDEKLEEIEYAFKNNLISKKERDFRRQQLLNL